MWSIDTHMHPNGANQTLFFSADSHQEIPASVFSPQFSSAHMRLISHSPLSLSHLSAFVYPSFIISVVTKSDTGANSVWSLNGLSSIWKIWHILRWNDRYWENTIGCWFTNFTCGLVSFNLAVMRILNKK